MDEYNKVFTFLQTIQTRNVNIKSISEKFNSEKFQINSTFFSSDIDTEKYTYQTLGGFQVNNYDISLQIFSDKDESIFRKNIMIVIIFMIITIILKCLMKE